MILLWHVFLPQLGHSLFFNFFFTFQFLYLYIMKSDHIFLISFLWIPSLGLYFFSKFFKTVSLIHSILVLADEVSLAGWWALGILLLILPVHSAGIKNFEWHTWLLTNYFGSISSHFTWLTNIYSLQIKVSPKPQNQKIIFLIKKFFIMLF